MVSLHLAGITLKIYDELDQPEKIMEKIKKIEIHDQIFEETYTAHIQSSGANWLGWIPEVPKVKCEEPTKAVLLKALEKNFMRSLSPKKRLGKSSLRQM